MKRKTMERKTIKQGIGFKVYKYEGLIFVDTYGPFACGFDTMQGAAEHLYYAGLLPEKTAECLLNYEE